MIIKVSSSGKQLQVVASEDIRAGEVFGTSVEWVKGLLVGKSPAGFVQLTKMPFMVAASRFKPSPVFNPDSGEKELVNEVLSTSNDAFSQRVLDKKKVKASFKDKVVF